MKNKTKLNCKNKSDQMESRREVTSESPFTLPEQGEKVHADPGTKAGTRLEAQMHRGHSAVSLKVSEAGLMNHKRLLGARQPARAISSGHRSLSLPSFPALTRIITQQPSFCCETQLLE